MAVLDVQGEQIADLPVRRSRWEHQSTARRPEPYVELGMLRSSSRTGPDTAALDMCMPFSLSLSEREREGGRERERGMTPTHRHWPALLSAPEMGVWLTTRTVWSASSASQWLADELVSARNLQWQAMQFCRSTMVCRHVETEALLHEDSRASGLPIL